MRDNFTRLSSQRREVLRALLQLSIPASLVYCVLNIRLGAPGLAALDLALAVLSLSLLWALRRGLPQEWLAGLFLAGLYTLVFQSFRQPDVHPFMEAWISLIPVLSYTLLKMRNASWVALLLTATTLCGYFLGADLEPSRLAPVQLLDVATPTMVVGVLCHVFARSMIVSEGMVLSDSLTGLGNRERLLSEFRREEARALRSETPLSLVLIDLDRFKSVNDRYGHSAGDAALRFFADLLQSRLRESDLACRLGGEEFMLLLPETDRAEALHLAEAIRWKLEVANFEFQGQSIPLTLSAGVAQYGVDGESWMQLYRATDSRLYACKRQGRNRVLATSGSENACEPTQSQPSPQPS